MKKSVDNRFEIMLKGGHKNSLGKAHEVIEIILKNRNKLSVLFDCYLSNDETVRLRVSNAFKRIFRHNREWFIEYIDKFQTLIPNLKQPSAEWTLSQLHLEIKDLLSESQKKIDVNITKKQLDKSNDWIVIIKSIDLLESLAIKDLRLRKWLIERLNIIADDNRKSVSKRATNAIIMLR